MSDDKCGIILLHGWADIPPGGFPKGAASKPFVTSSTFGLGLKNCVIKEPKAPAQPATAVPVSFLPQAVGISSPRSWFNFTVLPAFSVLSKDGGESKKGLQEALGWVEQEIELVDSGVPSTNIIVLGFSQGGALTFYTAVHTKYKLGGFIAFGAWLPLLKAEPITTLTTPVNKDTPILQLHGTLDEVVFYKPAAKKTKKEMAKVFTKYQSIRFNGAHMTTTMHNPVVVSMARRWIKDNVKFRLRNSTSSNSGSSTE